MFIKIRFNNQGERTQGERVVWANRPDTKYQLQHLRKHKPDTKYIIEKCLCHPRDNLLKMMQGM